MIGYYIHHHGRGHLARATAIADHIEITGLSSLPRPEDWPGDWIELPIDDAESVRDPHANGRLHWAPLHASGLCTRSAAISDWIAVARPAAFVVDVSVEVSLLARLHGIPIITFALPGNRMDRAHRLGFDIATSILAAWPAGVRGMDLGLPSETRRRVVPVGAIGRFDPADREPPTDGPTDRRVLVLAGTGGDGITQEAVTAARAATPRWRWKHLGGSGEWVSDIWPHLQDATVVVTHAGEGALADVSAARRPAIVIPQPRPHDEQRVTAAVLGSGLWPALVVDRWPRRGWAGLLDRAGVLDGGAWKWWNDGNGAQRAADAILDVARGES